MESKFNELRTIFNGIKDIREEINNIFVNLEQRVAKLKDIYKEFINNNNSTLFIFGLDSFYFQNKLIDIEFSDMKRFYDLIMNRMYCEYYKLYKIILNYGNVNLIDDKKFIESIQKNTNYPLYKDLEPYKKYDFHFIDEIHEDIVSILISINSYLSNKKHILSSYKIRSDVGLNINNFVSTYEFEVSAIDSQLGLFCSYVDFFHELHLKYLKRFITKIQILYGQINHDIKFDEVLLSNKADKKKYMNEMKNEIDKETMKALRSSIHIDKKKEDMSSDSDEESKEEEIKSVENKIQQVLINNIQESEPSVDIPFMVMPIKTNDDNFIDENFPLHESVPEPVLESAPEPAHEPAPESAPEPAPESAAEPVPEPAPEPALKTMSEKERGPSPNIENKLNSIISKIENTHKQQEKKDEILESEWQTTKSKKKKNKKKN